MSSAGLRGAPGVAETADFVVIGAGIAGASAAYELSDGARVVLVEAEDHPGYHATGRSAAVFTGIYGNAVIRALTAASRPFFDVPPAGFASAPLLTPRPLLMIGRSDQRHETRALYDTARTLVPELAMLDEPGVRALVPVFQDGYVAEAVFEPTAQDLDVHAIHQGFLRGARARGARVAVRAEVVGLDRRGGDWEVRTRDGMWSTPVVINAAGAWADAVAGLAGVAQVGLVPKRRTAFTFSVTPETDVRDWPTVIDVSEAFYFKPDAGRLLGSPADETSSEPCDAQPEDIDVAIAIDRITRAVTLEVRRIESRWAGLRSFVADKTPVVGFDPEAEGFFWLAAQGGYGIQTSPAMGRLAAALARSEACPGDITALGINESHLSPRRLGRAARQNET
jgi:D-arginine dehydrogenase